MSKLEVALPDERVLPIQDLLYQENAILVDWHTDFVTVRHEPPYAGVLPEGHQGVTNKPVYQFMVVSDYPPSRPIQHKAGVRHGTVATLYEQDWESSEKDFSGGHYVKGDDGKIKDPLERIFRGLLAKHKWEVTRLSTIMN